MRQSPKAECMRCGFIRTVATLRTEWTGLRVCRDCHDPKPAEHRPPQFKPEGVIVPGASPETTPRYREIVGPVFDDIIFDETTFDDYGEAPL